MTAPKRAMSMFPMLRKMILLTLHVALVFAASDPEVSGRLSLPPGPSPSRSPSSSAGSSPRSSWSGSWTSETLSRSSFRDLDLVDDEGITRMACSDTIPLIVDPVTDRRQIEKLFDFAQKTDGTGTIVFIDGDQFNPYLFGANNHGCKIIASAPEHVFFVIFTAEDRTKITDDTVELRGENPKAYKEFLKRDNVWAELELPNTGEMVDNKIRAVSIYLASKREAGRPLFDRWVVVSNDNAWIMGNSDIDVVKQSQKGNNPEFTTRIFESIENCLKDTCESGQLPSVIPLRIDEFNRAPPNGWYFNPNDVSCIRKDIKLNPFSFDDSVEYREEYEKRCAREIARSKKGWPFKCKRFVNAILTRSAVQIRQRFLAGKMRRGGKKTPLSRDVLGKDHPALRLGVFNCGSHDPENGLRHKRLTRQDQEEVWEAKKKAAKEARERELQLEMLHTKMQDLLTVSQEKPQRVTKKITNLKSLLQYQVLQRKINTQKQTYPEFVQSITNDPKWEWDANTILKNLVKRFGVLEYQNVWLYRMDKNDRSYEPKIDALPPARANQICKDIILKPLWNLSRA